MVQHYTWNRREPFFLCFLFTRRIVIFPNRTICCLPYNYNILTNHTRVSNTTFLPFCCFGVGVVVTTVVVFTVVGFVVVVTVVVVTIFGVLTLSTDFKSFRVVMDWLLVDSDFNSPEQLIFIKNIKRIPLYLWIKE